MSSITNRESIKRRIQNDKAIEKFKTKKLGLIFTGEYEGLDEHLVEAEVRKHFDIDNIKEIFTVGKREKTFKYANRFAKRINVPVTATPLENYTWDDIDLPIKRNSIIVYNSDSVIIFHGDKQHNTVAWYALSSAKRVFGRTGETIFINAVPKPILSGFEKEIFDVIQIQDTKFIWEEAALLEEHYFELRKRMLTTFSKYAQLGEKMNFKDVLFKISELSVKGKSRGVYDGTSFICDSIINYLVAMIEESFDENYKGASLDGIASFVKKNINPSYQSLGNEAEDNICFVLLRNSWYQLEYLMHDMIHDYSVSHEDEEVYAALCFAKWILIMNSRCIETEEIARKYKSVKNFISTIQ